MALSVNCCVLLMRVSVFASCLVYIECVVACCIELSCAIESASFTVDCVCLYAS